MSREERIKATPESRAKAVEARRAAIAAGAHYRRDYADADHWAELARKRGIRLPPWWEAPTPGKLKSWRQALVDEPFQAFYGLEITYAELIARNPDMPLRAFVGQMLAAAAERQAPARMKAAEPLVGQTS